jgi:flagellar biosynthesis GTPase FlhF
MTILTFTGEDSAAAMEKMADQLGENCFIVSTAKRGNQIEISATDNPAEAGWGKRKAKPRKKFADIFSETSTQMAGNNRGDNRDENAGAAEGGGDRSISGYQIPAYIADLQAHMVEMKSMLNGMVLTDDVALRNDLGLSTPVQLRQLGFSDVIVHELKHSFVDVDYETGQRRFLVSLADKLVHENSQSALQADVTFVVGGHGVGKTSLAGKLAAHMLEGGEKKPVTLAEMADTNTNPDDSLLQLARLINAPVCKFRSDDIADQMTAVGERYVVDVSCAPDIASEAITQVRDALPGARVTIVLALAGASSTRLIRQQTGAFGKLEPMVCLTKLDECAAGPAEFSQIAQSGEKLGLLTGSRAMIDSLSFADVRPVADYIAENC